VNFRTVVASDAVGDRAQGPQEANLFDMGQKYADLLSVGEIMAALWSHTESVMEGAKSA
jgi:maleamate amidohydrolase